MNNKGFTLLEIMIVLSILGILMLVTVPNFNSSKEDFYLDTSAKICTADLRYAQQLSIDTKSSYGVYFEKSGYKLKNAAGDVVKNVEFSGSVEYQLIKTSVVGLTINEIVFDAQGVPINVGEIDLKISGNNSHVYINVTSKTGEVRVLWK